MITYGSTTLTSYNSITSTEVYYYKSSSATALSGGSWSTTKPTWENGKYIWQKIRTLYEDGTYTESDPVNITGQQGATGAAAYSYKLNASDTIIGKTKTGEYTVNKITFSATSKQGTSAVTAYSGRFKIETTEDGLTWTTSYTSSANESSKEFTIPENIVAVKCSLYQAGGVTVLLDIVTIPVVKDGVDAIGLKDSIPIYLASDKATGVTKLDLGWTRYRPELTAEKKYLWVYYVSRFSEGDTDPELIEIKNDVVSFENHGDVSPVESCIVDINPIQEISESEEVNPISGWNNITATRVGKNLLRLPEYEEIITYEIHGGYYKIPIKLSPNTDYYLHTEYLNDYTSIGKSQCYVFITPDPSGTDNYKAIGHPSKGIIDGIVKSTLDGYLFLSVYRLCTQEIYDELKNNCEVILSVGTTPVTYEPYQRINYQCSVESAENKNLVIYDKEPYLFKKSKSSQIKFLEEDIVGGTVCWNQFVQNGDFSDDTDNWQVYPSSGGTLTATNNIATFTMNQTLGTKTVIQQVNKIPVDHVVLWGCDIKTTTDNEKTHVCIYYNSSRSAASNINTRLWLASPEIGYDDTWHNRNIITRNADANAQYILVGTASGTTNTNVTVEFKNVQLFDLTQMFGTEIADYILELEQSKKGAGVAWFRKYFPNNYYDYNSGEVMHVTNLQSHDMVGFNLFDKTIQRTDNRYLIDNGNIVSNISWSVTDYIPIVGNQTYYLNCTFGDGPAFCWYDSSKTFISGIAGKNVTASKLITAPQNAHFLRASIKNTDIDTACINLSGTRDGEYEPYVKHSYPLDSSLILRGIPKLTADGDLTYDGDIYKSDGTVERRYGIVDLGTLKWGVHTAETGVFRSLGLSTLTPSVANSTIANFICDKFITSAAASPMPNNAIAISSAGYLFIKDSIYANVSAANFKAAMSGVYLVYELTESTTEEAQPYASSQLIDDWSTEEYITDSIVPVGHETNYYNNTVYGGQYNITTGELAVTHDVVDLGALTYSTRYTGTNNKVLSTELPFNPESGLSLIAENYAIIDSVAGAAALSPPDDHDKGIYKYGNQNSKTIYIVCGVKDNPKGKLVYQTAEPKTYSLTPQEVTALTGQNHVYADSGEVTINYYDNQKSTELHVDYSYLSTFETAQIAKEIAETALLQIDGKIETWCQSTDPAIAWITDELKNQHDGDLWYYTGESTNSFNNNTTYKYTASNNTWVAYSASADLFDKIDNKTSIYYGTTASITTAETGDYLVDSTDGSSYRWDGNNWVKVTDYKTAIDDIEIGGRNLLLKSAIEKIGASNTAQWMQWAISDSPLVPNEEYIFSFDAKMSNNTDVFYIGFALNSSTQQIMKQGVLVTDTYERYTYQVKTTKTNINSIIISNAKNYGNGNANNTTGVLNIKNVKLEKGNKATKWTPAPEDTETAISNAQDTANTALMQSSWYAICDTAGATIDKVATISPVTTSFTLREGTTAIIKFVNTNSGAIGSLKLNVNNTGAKPIKYIYNGELANIPSPGYLKGGQSYQFYYDGTNWVVQMIYNTNINTVGVYGGTVTAGTNGIRGYTLIMRDTENTWVSITTDAGAGTKDGGTGTNHVKYAGGLYPDSVMYESTQSNYAAGASAAVCYLALGLNLRYSTNCGTTLIKNKPVYLVGELHNDGLFYLDDIWWTQTVPTAENGKTYIYLGMAYSNYQIYLATEKPMYQYYDGEFMTYNDVQTALAAKSATNYMSSDNTGIMVADMTDGVEKLPSDTTLTGSNVFITAGYGSGNTAVPAGVHIRDGRTDIARFGATAQIGKDNKGHVLIDNDSVNIWNNTTKIATFGENCQIGANNTNHLNLTQNQIEGVTENGRKIFQFGTLTDAIAGETGKPFYTFGTRNDLGQVGEYSFVQGEGNVAAHKNQAVFGQYSRAGYYTSNTVEMSSTNNSFTEDVSAALIEGGYTDNDVDVVGISSDFWTISNGIISVSIPNSYFYDEDDTERIIFVRYWIYIGKKFLFQVGNGTENMRSDAFAVREDGRTYAYGSFTATKANYDVAENCQIVTTAGTGNNTAGNSISLMATSGGNVGLYNPQKSGWDLVHSASSDKTTIPFLGFTSTTTGTVASTFNGANTKSCLLYKVGKIVFMNLALHYTNASSTIATNTTMFTIPTSYRPASESTVLANIGIKVTSSTTNPCATCTLKISTAGAITQAYSSNIYSIYAFGMWETS